MPVHLTFMSPIFQFISLQEPDHGDRLLMAGYLSTFAPWSISSTQSSWHDAVLQVHPFGRIDFSVVFSKLCWVMIIMQIIFNLFCSHMPIQTLYKSSLGHFILLQLLHRTLLWPPEVLATSSSARATFCPLVLFDGFGCIFFNIGWIVVVLLYNIIG